MPPCADPLVCCVLSWSCVEAAPPSPYVLRLESLVLLGVGKVTGVAVRRCCLLLIIEPITGFTVQTDASENETGRCC